MLTIISPSCKEAVVALGVAFASSIVLTCDDNFGSSKRAIETQISVFES